MIVNSQQPTVSGIFRFAFVTSFVSFLAFGFLDYLKPGFVANYFSLHWFLLTAIIFGVLWAMYDEEIRQAKWLSSLIMVISGLVLAWMVWRSAIHLAGLRYLVILLIAVLPFVLWKLLNRSIK